jgi:hypothetical protein
MTRDVCSRLSCRLYEEVATYEQRPRMKSTSKLALGQMQQQQLLHFLLPHNLHSHSRTFLKSSDNSSSSPSDASSNLSFSTFRITTALQTIGKSLQGFEDFNRVETPYHRYRRLEVGAKIVFRLRVRVTKLTRTGTIHKDRKSCIETRGWQTEGIMIVMGLFKILMRASKPVLPISVRWDGIDRDQRRSFVCTISLPYDRISTSNLIRPAYRREKRDRFPLVDEGQSQSVTDSSYLR